MISYFAVHKMIAIEADYRIMRGMSAYLSRQAYWRDWGRFLYRANLYV